MRIRLSRNDRRKKIYSLEEIGSSPKKLRLFKSFLPQVIPVNLEIFFIIRIKEQQMNYDYSSKSYIINKLFRSLRMKLLARKECLAKKNLQNLILFEKNKKNIITVCAVTIILLLIFGKILVISILMFFILLFYIPLVISNEYLKEYIIIKAIHKGQTNIKVSGNSIEETEKNKATIVNNIHKGVYPISRPELYAYSDMQFINESMENLNNMNSIIKDYRLIIIRDGEKSMIMNN